MFTRQRESGVLIVLILVLCRQRGEWCTDSINTINSVFSATGRGALTQ